MHLSKTTNNPINQGYSTKAKPFPKAYKAEYTVTFGRSNKSSLTQKEAKTVAKYLIENQLLSHNLKSLPQIANEAFWTNEVLKNQKAIAKDSNLIVGKVAFDKEQLKFYNHDKIAPLIIDKLANQTVIPAEVKTELNSLGGTTPIIVQPIKKPEMIKILGVLRESFRMNETVQLEGEEIEVQESITWPFIKALMTNQEELPKKAKPIVEMIDNACIYKINCPDAPKLEEYLNEKVSKQIQLKRNIAGFELAKQQYVEEIPIGEVSATLLFAAVVAVAGEFGAEYLEKAINQPVIAAGVRLATMSGIDVVDNILGESAITIADAVAFGLDAEYLEEGLSKTSGTLEEISTSLEGSSHLFPYIKQGLEKYLDDVRGFSGEGSNLFNFLNHVQDLQKEHPELEELLELAARKPEKTENLAKTIKKYVPKLAKELESLTSEAEAIEEEYQKLSNGLEELTTSIGVLKKKVKTKSDRTLMDALIGDLKDLKPNLKTVSGKNSKSVLVQLFQNKSNFSDRAIKSAVKGAMQGALLNIPPAFAMTPEAATQIASWLGYNSDSVPNFLSSPSPELTATVGGLGAMTTSLGLLNNYGMTYPQMVYLANKLEQEELIKIPEEIDKKDYLKQIAHEELAVRSGMWASLVSFALSPFPGAVFLLPSMTDGAVTPEMANLLYMVTAASSENIARLGLLQYQRKGLLGSKGGMEKKINNAAQFLFKRESLGNPLSKDESKHLSKILLGRKNLWGKLAGGAYDSVAKLSLTRPFCPKDYRNLMNS